MKKLTIILAIGFFAFASCSKLEIAEGTPKCIEKEIADFNKNALCEDARVTEHLFQGNTTYVFGPGTCGADLAAPVIDADCNALGSLGGFTGNTEINGQEFSEATFVRTVWEK